MSIREEALRLAREHGWSIVPVMPGKKSPSVPWQKYQKRAATPAQIQHWWKEQPRANAAVVCGRVSNLVVIDVDPRNGGDPEPILKSHPTGLISRTGGGGWHLYYLYPDTEDAVSIAHQLDEWEGVDIQADGRIVVLPPSLHSSGNFYQWQSQEAMAPCPIVLYEFEALTPKAEEKKAQDQEKWLAETLSKPIAKGGRNNTITRIAGYMVKQMPADVFRATMLAVNAGLCRPPLKGEELSRTLDSIVERATRAGQIGAAGTPTTFFRGKQFVPSRMGRYVIEQAPVVEIGERLHAYLSGRYIEAEKRIESLIVRCLGESWAPSHQNASMDWLRAVTGVRTEHRDPDVINVLNGLLHWRTGELRQHTPSYVTRTQIPHDWDPNARCPRIEQFLADTLPDQACVDLFLEICGYALLNDLPFRHAFVLYGPTGTGKSVTLRVLQTLVGDDNTIGITLQDLEDRFRPAQLDGKLLNLVPDIGTERLSNTSALKRLTSGETIQVEHKNRDPFMMVPTAIHIFSANELPGTRDRSDAYFRRMVVLPVKRQIKEEDQDPTLGEQLTQEDEMRGLLVLAVTALRRLMERRRFEMPAVVEEEQHEYKLQADPALNWIEANLSIDPDYQVRRSVLYDNYTYWCREHSHRPVSEQRLWMSLRTWYSDQAGESLQEGGRSSAMGRSWRGIRIREQQLQAELLD